MKIIDRVISNSKPFKELVESVEKQVELELNDYGIRMSADYAAKVERLADLTERLHNTILSVKHNQDSH